jgi:YegS/Rv2252/BmrU family lipid kinase
VNILVICNPISGGGRAARLSRRLRELLERRGHDVDLFLTSAAGDARRRASQATPDVDRIVSVGGDGTLNEVLNGLEDPSRTPLTQLATGTANLLAHDLNLPYDAEGVGRLLERGTIRRLDLGLVGDRRFLMVVSSGFDAMVTLEAQGNRTGPMNYARWLPSIVKVLREYEPPRFTVRVDDRDPIEGQLVIVSNVRNYGGLFTVADRAVCDSGLLDVCVLTRAALPGLMRALVSGLTGGLSRTAGVVYVQGTRIGITSNTPVPVELDGDPFGTTPIQISLRPRHVPIVVPSR